MKKISYIFALVFVVGILLSSCNRKVCPAYSQNDEQEQTDNPKS